MSKKNLITQDLLMFQKLHTVKGKEAGETFDKIFKDIVYATNDKLLTFEDAENLIDILVVLYDTLPRRN